MKILPVIMAGGAGGGPSPPSPSPFPKAIFIIS